MTHCNIWNVMVLCNLTDWYIPLLCFCLCYWSVYIPGTHHYEYSLFKVILAKKYLSMFNATCIHKLFIWVGYGTHIIPVHTAKQLRVSATLLLPFWTYDMSWAHNITTAYTCANNTSCNQPKVVPELEISAPTAAKYRRVDREHSSYWQYAYLSSYYITMTLFQYILIIFVAQRFATNSIWMSVD